MIFRYVFIFIFTFLFAFSRDLNIQEINNIEKIINSFKNNDIDYISENLISFPLDRAYPIPSIKNKDELKKRFNEVFDSKLISMIANSKIEDWSEVGWRGIMLNNGILWLGDEKIFRINYISEFEVNLKKDLLKKDKEQLHYSLNNFLSPIHKIKTDNYLIRIDELECKESKDCSNYRYSSWKKNISESSKPDLVLIDNKIEYSGSGGNHSYSFKNNNYTYIININVLSSDESGDSSLNVLKDGNSILYETGKILKP